MPRPAEPLDRLVGFGRYLRGRGLPVGTGRILSFCRAAAVLRPLEPESLYWAGRSTLVASREHIEPFDRAFEAYFGRPAAGEEPPPREQGPSPHDRRTPGSVDAPPPAPSWRPGDAGEEPEGRTAARIVASEIEILRRRSFEDLSEEERARTAALIRRIAVAAPTRRARRLRNAPDGSRFDLRRTLRRSLRTEGEPFDRAWKARRIRPRPLTLLLDVSGSMAPYSRQLLQFGFASMAAGGRVEVFCFGTRLTRVTGALRTRNPDRALREVARRVEDWEAGTRIGESLKELVDRWGQRSGLRGAVVVLCSDGLERGDPDLLRAQMARLSRLAHRVVWVNPLKGSPRYEPLARGMATALPFVDVFLPGHNLEAVEELARAIAG
ncbi:MAG: VWA domain-containing protein [Actinobacteria bacterium]|nr:VWA domain-containing protein [Actinomycetota bacterium]